MARSLVGSGHVVTVAAGRRWSLAGSSRRVRPVRMLADALATPELYAREVSRMVEQIGAEVLLPITDAAVDAILEHRQLLPRATLLPLASRHSYRAASDKVLVHELACAAGIGIADSAVLENAGDEAPDRPSLYPGVIKPHRSVVGDAVRSKTRVRFVDSRAECMTVLSELDPRSFPVLIQRRIRGPGEGFFFARWNGRTIARFAHRRLREKPPAGGVSVYRESIPADPVVMAACESMLDRLDWQGVAMIEGKRDLDSGQWQVMEINGRFWGSLQLAIDSGVDFPAILLDALLTDGEPQPPAWLMGSRSRWEWGDLDHLMIRMRRSSKYLRLAADAPSRLRAISAFLTHRPGRDHLEVFRIRDPLPFVVESLGRMGLGR